MRGWLVNDRLTCIPGTRTLWHFLLDWLPGLEDHTGGHTPFPRLADKIEAELAHGKPDYIIRNATYFRALNTDIPTISILQDVHKGDRDQEIVCDKSSLVVFNSEYTRAQYPDLARDNHVIIPIGTDFGLFRPLEKTEDLQKKWDIPKRSVLFIGADSAVKGFGLVRQLVENSSLYFVLVMKDNFMWQRNNVKVFNRLTHEDLVEVINCCDVGICTSNVETQHLAGIEMGACDLPLLTTNVGIYYNREPGIWGRVAQDGPSRDYRKWISALEEMLDTQFGARAYWQDQGLDLDGCKRKWRNVVDELV